MRREACRLLEQRWSSAAAEPVATPLTLQMGHSVPMTSTTGALRAVSRATPVPTCSWGKRRRTAMAVTTLHATESSTVQGEPRQEVGVSPLGGDTRARRERAAQDRPLTLLAESEPWPCVWLAPLRSGQGVEEPSVSRAQGTGCFRHEPEQ